MILPVLASLFFGGIGIAFVYATLWPRSQIWGPLLWHGTIDKREIALTFDDGPTPGVTEAILDTLKAHQVYATFFVIGENARKHPAILRRIYNEGHLIANHSWDHPHHGWLGFFGYWQAQLGRTDEAIEQIIGQRPAIFRPPVGIKNCFTLAAARRLGHTTVTWSIRARDGVATDATEILRRLSHLQPGDIVLMHDGIRVGFKRDPQATIEALPKLLASLDRRGLKAVRLDQLLNLPPYAANFSMATNSQSAVEQR